MQKSLVYDINGDIKPINDLYENKPFFRKYTNKSEIKIVKKLMKYPHNNICKYYRISDNNDYIDMELLDVETTISKSNLLDISIIIKNYLQSIGIIYIDWKEDQFGIDKNGNIKLFDFDFSGIINRKTNKWIIEPITYGWSYREAIKENYKNPLDIDNYCFSLMLKDLKNYHLLNNPNILLNLIKNLKENFYHLISQYLHY